jgi:FMN-dependent NADH-azoreductase
MTSVNKPNILVINSSVTPQTSRSSALSKEVVFNFLHDSTCSYINLGQEPHLYINDEWVTASTTLEYERTDRQKTILELSDSLIDQLKKTDIIVIEFTMYKFSLPLTLKNYFDLICRDGCTFKHTPSGSVGLLTDKRVVICTSSMGTPRRDEIEYVTAHIKRVCGIIGITDIDIITDDSL